MADVTIDDLSATAAIAATTLFEVLTDPSGTPASEKATGTQVRAFVLAGYSANIQTMLGAADYAAVRAQLDLEAGTDFLAYSSFSANGISLVGAADYAAMRALLDLEAGTDFLAYSSFSANGISLVGAANYAAMRGLLDLEAGTDFYSIAAADAAIAAVISDTAYDATSWNGVTTVAPSKNAVRDKFESLGALSALNTVGTSQIDDDAVTFAKLLNATAAGFIGATAAGAFSERTPAQVTAALDAMVGDSGAGGTKGLVPAPAAGDAAASKFLKADGTWAAPAGGGSVSDTAYASSWDGVTTDAPSKNAVYDKFEGLQHPGYISANWYVLSEGAFVAANGTALAANTIYYVPIVLPRRVTLSDLGCVITSSSAGNVALGIYANDASTGKPSGAVLAATGNISSASTGPVSADITGSDVTLTPGFYWLAFWSDTTPTLIAENGLAQVTAFSRCIGSATIGNVLTNTPRTIHCVSSSETYNASAWPNATTEAPTEVTTSIRHYVMLGKSA